MTCQAVLLNFTEVVTIGSSVDETIFISVFIHVNIFNRCTWLLGFLKLVNENELNKTEN